MHPIVSLATSSRTVLVPFQRSAVTSSCAASNAVNLLVTYAEKLYCFLFLEFLKIQNGMLWCLCLLASLTFSIAMSN